MAIFGKKKDTDLTLPEKLPSHLGFIMDGNGRRAKKRGLPRPFGHKEGAKTLRKIVRHCKDIGLKHISFYAFSTENWQRPQEEVDTIMRLFSDYLDDVQELLTEKTRMVFLGDKAIFPDYLREKMLKVEAETAQFDEMVLFLAVNYGGRDEIAHSARLIAEKVKNGELQPEDITEQTISDGLYTAGYPDVDLVIRPSGELRLSNFLIWQCAYAEYYFTDILWPDFSPDDLDAALIDYAGRNRRFGGV
ncbi:MAG: di-trans,poly-cis-decaprenylcistransferase [Ruminococcus sp.]|nr:di-trans,poly-cis-decaprenylcistransferase [Ruminococcus sp.]